MLQVLGRFNRAPIRYLGRHVSTKHSALCQPSSSCQPAEMSADSVNSSPAPAKGTIEHIYQKKTQLEHILLRPDTYIGSVQPVTEPMWVVERTTGRMCQRQLTYVPGLYKIFDEILVNAADHKQNDPNMKEIRIDISRENNEIRIQNDGRGIPVVQHKKEKMYVPTMIFGHLLTSSNFDDSQKKVTGGRNGYGAKLCNIYSKEFAVETRSRKDGKKFKQVWRNNMKDAGPPEVSPLSEKAHEFTKITFRPDLKRFGMDVLDDDVMDLFTRRAYDVAASTRGVRVLLNGDRLKINSFRDYVDLFVKDEVDGLGNPIKVCYERVNDRWEVALAPSLERGFTQMSFVNSIATTKGGKHVDFVADQITKNLVDVVKKKTTKSGVTIRPNQIRNHMWLFINVLIENPTFDSQTKENMTLVAKSFGSKCELHEPFFKQVLKCGIVEAVMSWVNFKAQDNLAKSCHAKKQSKIKGIPKLDDANDAGTKYSGDCTLILTEGDSAKALAVAGLGVIGRDRYGVFPLRGKLLNTRDASVKQIQDNKEIDSLVKIIGLHYTKKYDGPDALAGLRYGKVMIMTDQDQDGSHIKGLLINFFHHKWPALLRQRFLVEFITPIVKVTKGQQELSFFSMPEFDDWKASTSNWASWRIKYYKGLGTSTSKEAKDYFSNMGRHRIPFRYIGVEDDQAIDLAFSKKRADDRKEWLSTFMNDRRRRLENNEPEDYLYRPNMHHLTYSDFVNRELILFSNADLERSIPSLVDGLKPGQRKVLFTCMKRNDKREVKVAQLAGSVAELSAYHHGEQSLMSTIINLAQNFVGSNNANLLQPNGQFGTRLHGGKDAASPRYIFTQLSSLARRLFPSADDPLLNYLYDDNLRVEPSWYCPVVPAVLLNGAEGIGTGWSTKVPCYNPNDVVENILRKLDGKPMRPMLPWYRNFRGTIVELGDQRLVINGYAALLPDSGANVQLEITELPVGTWTQDYKEKVVEPLLVGTDKEPPRIQAYREYHTDQTVRFLLTLTRAQYDRMAANGGLYRSLKLQTTMSLSSMVLFDHLGCIKRYSNVMDIMDEFFDVRMRLYVSRKRYVEAMLQAEADKLSNQARFVHEVIDGYDDPDSGGRLKLELRNVKRQQLLGTLVRRGFDPDPVMVWKKTLAADKNALQQATDQGDDDDQDDQPDNAPSDDGQTPARADEVKGDARYNYLLNMPLWSLTRERYEALLRQRDKHLDELDAYKATSAKDLWRHDLCQFQQEYQKVLAQDAEELMESVQKASVGTAGPSKTAKGVRKTASKTIKREALPSKLGAYIEPVIAQELVDKLNKDAQLKKPRAKKDDGPPADDKLPDDDDSSESKSGRAGSKRPGPLAAAGAAAVVAVKRKKTKSAASDDDDDDDQPSDLAERSDDQPVPARQPSKRGAAARAHRAMVIETTDDDDMADGDLSEDDGRDSDDEFVPAKKRTGAGRRRLSSSSSSSDADVAGGKGVAMTSKAPLRKKTIVSDSDDQPPVGADGHQHRLTDRHNHDDDDDDDNDGNANGNNNNNDDNDDDDDDSASDEVKPLSVRLKLSLAGPIETGSSMATSSKSAVGFGSAAKSSTKPASAAAKTTGKTAAAAKPKPAVAKTTTKSTSKSTSKSTTKSTSKTTTKTATKATTKTTKRPKLDHHQHHRSSPFSSSDDDDHDDDDSRSAASSPAPTASAAPARPRRARQPVKYHFGASDDDDESDHSHQYRPHHDDHDDDNDDDDDDDYEI